MRAAFTLSVAPGRVVTTAVHAGHDLRPDIAGRIALDEATRLREEDPFTDLLVADHGTGLVVHRSRFEVDLNRPREQAIYLEPDDAWGLDVWERPLPENVVQESLAIYDGFYELLALTLDRFVASEPFLVLDLHSYNHRRAGPDAPPEPAADNPEINVGTGALDRDRWGHVIDGFIEQLRHKEVLGSPLDVGENIRFRGGELSRWVAARYPDQGCVLAVEFKKTFMDEWTGIPDHRHLGALRGALDDAVRGTLANSFATEPV